MRINTSHLSEEQWGLDGQVSNTKLKQMHISILSLYNKKD